MSNGVLLEQMRTDNQSILSEGGFQTDITVVSRDANTTVVIPGTATLHNTQIDPETGVFVNVRNASITINQAELEETGFPVYSGKIANDIYLKDVKVSFVDANGKVQNFIANDVRPSYTFGCITILLGNAE